MECQGGMVVDDRRPPQPIGCRVRCRENRPLHPSTTLYIGLTVSRGVCRASTALQHYTAAVTPLQLYSSTTLYSLQPLHPHPLTGVSGAPTIDGVVDRWEAEARKC